jgi:hypothetical protein
MKKLTLELLILTTITIAGFVCVAAQDKTQEANIYLLKTGEENAKYPLGLVAVKRQVDRRSPLRSALEILTDGATVEEAEKQNLASSTWGIKLVSVRIKNRTAYTYFTMPEEARFSGDGAPFIFEEAVKKTVMQFRGVKRVVVCLNGILDFGSESEEPPGRCR